MKLLSADGTISNETDLKYSRHKELLNQLGVNITNGTSSNSEALWENFDILMKDIKSNMMVECGARDPNELNSKFYNSVVVIAASHPGDETENVCELTNKRVVSSISTLSVLLAIVLVAETVIMLVTLKFYCIRRVRKSANQPGDHSQGEVIHNHSAISNIEDNHVNQRIGKSMIERKEPPLAHCQVDEQNVPQAPIDGQTVPPVPVDEQKVPQALIDGQIVPLAHCQVDKQNVPSAPVDEQHIPLPLAPVDGQNIPLSQVIRVLPAEDIENGMFIQIDSGFNG